jgi:Tetratricopeptide repeat
VTAGRLAVAVLALAAPALAAPQPQRVIDVTANRAADPTSFPALWASYREARQAGQAEEADRLFREIRRLRIERNIHSLRILALALVSQGLEGLSAGNRDGAEAAFRAASGLDPYLPDAAFGLALSHVKRGPLGILPALRDTAQGLTIRLATSAGRYFMAGLLIPVLLIGVLAAATAVAVALVLRHGTLLHHDLEESFGVRRARTFAYALYGLLLALPVLTFQGYGWLPFWWLALLLVYMGPIERFVCLFLVLAAAAVGPLIEGHRARLLAFENPMFQASLATAEEGPDPRAAEVLRAAAGQHGDDRDLKYLLGRQLRMEGRYEDSAGLYQELLAADPKDFIALNNLANLEFTRGDYQPAIVRYKQGIEGGAPAEYAATFYYNLSLAHLQKFEYQPAQEARLQAERLAPGVVSSYDSTWKYDKGDYAVVDLGLTPDQVWAKYAGAAQGVARQNLAGQAVGSVLLVDPVAALLNRFTGLILVFGFAFLALSAWRGRKTFTMRCLKCGTPFCRRCHLGAAVAGLCSQCHHLFVVRDGVSGPARNQKLTEVQKEDGRRERIFRILSLLSPGAGHVYASKTLLGAAYALVWYLLLASVLLAGRLLPVTEASSQLSKPLGLVVAGVLLLAIYVAANRGRPEAEIVIPVARSASRRARAT